MHFVNAKGLLTGSGGHFDNCACGVGIFDLIQTIAGHDLFHKRIMDGDGSFGGDDLYHHRRS